MENSLWTAELGEIRSLRCFPGPWNSALRVASYLNEKMWNASINPDMTRLAAGCFMPGPGSGFPHVKSLECAVLVTKVPTAFPLLQGSAGPQGNPGPKGVRVSTPPAPLSSLLPLLICQLSLFISWKDQGGVKVPPWGGSLLHNMSALILPSERKRRKSTTRTRKRQGLKHRVSQKQWIMLNSEKGGHTMIIYNISDYLSTIIVFLW